MLSWSACSAPSGATWVNVSIWQEALVVSRILTHMCAVFHETGVPQFPVRKSIKLPKNAPNLLKKIGRNMHKCTHAYCIYACYLCKCWKREYQLKKQVLDGCASLGTVSVWVEEELQRTAAWSRFPNSQITTVRLVIRRLLHPLHPLSAGAFFLRFMCGSVFHILKILKLDQMQMYYRQEQKKKKMFFLKMFFFCKELVRLCLLLQPVHVQIKKKTACVFQKKTDASDLIWILTVC